MILRVFGRFLGVFERLWRVLEVSWPVLQDLEGSRHFIHTSGTFQMPAVLLELLRHFLQTLAIGDSHGFLNTHLQPS